MNEMIKFMYCMFLSNMTHVFKTNEHIFVKNIYCRRDSYRKFLQTHNIMALK